MTDFIIVGRGLAATSLMHAFYEQGISFKVVGDVRLSSCSRVAAGIWNPVVFKRLTKSWLAEELVSGLHSFYANCEARLKKKLITLRPIIKPFTEEQEKRLWIKRAETELQHFLDKSIRLNIPPELQQFKLANGYGLVQNAGNLNVSEFLEATSEFFSDLVRDEIFDHQHLEVSEEMIRYRDLDAKQIIFCEGFLVKENPYFDWIPLKPAKGEILTIKVPKLHLENAVFNRSGFLMDVSKEIYRAGATYAWDDLGQEPTQKGLQELHEKVKQMITCDYSILKHEAGIRPSSSDRRPLIGAHPLHKNMFVFNGLGTKGVMLAPYFSKNFVNFYLQNEPLHTEVNLNRFYHLYGKKNQA